MGATKKKERDPYGNVYSIRIEDMDVEYFDYLRDQLAEQTRMKVTRTWIITEMIRMGTPIFEKKYKLKRPVD